MQPSVPQERYPENAIKVRAVTLPWTPAPSLLRQNGDAAQERGSPG